jgi:DNA invertase Pin-like site-specific DNA recombinase
MGGETMAKAKALGYVRVSTDEQAIKGHGLDIQRRAIRDYCKASGLQLVDIVADEGLSGSNGLDNREGLATLLARIERHEASVLVVYRLDRLARKLYVQLTVIERLEKANARVVSVSEPDVDGPDELRELIRNILGSVAGYERAVIRGRMMAGRDAKVASGGYGGGRPPFGWRAENKELVPEPREQEVIALVRQLAEEGLSSRQIATRLEEAGHRPKVGAHWSSVQVLRIIQRT